MFQILSCRISEFPAITNVVRVGPCITCLLSNQSTLAYSRCRNYVSFSSFATDSRLQFCESLPFSNLTQEEESKIQNTYGRKTYFGIFYVILQISIRTKVNTRRHYTFNNFQLWALGPNKTPSSTKGTYRAYHFLR